MGVKFKPDDGKWLSCSPLIYEPQKRGEVWRFVTYMFLHADKNNLIGNMVLQIFVGMYVQLSIMQFECFTNKNVSDIVPFLQK